jgi:hypothetical protein
MGKKYSILTVVLLTISILVVSCNFVRGLSTPSTRIVGHWGVFEGGRRRVAEYFGPLDSYSVGSYIKLTGDSIYYARYRVLSESEETVMVEIFVGQDLASSIREYSIKDDGTSMKSENMEYQYVDARIQP